MRGKGSSQRKRLVSDIPKLKLSDRIARRPRMGVASLTRMLECLFHQAEFAHPRLAHLPGLRLVTLVSVAFAAIVFGTIAAAETSGLQTLARASFVRSDAPTPPSDAGVPITLPDPWDLRHHDLTGYAWYLIDWPLPDAPSGLQAIYLTATLLPTHVFVNGISVGLTGLLTGPRPRGWEQSDLFEVPAELLHAGVNRVALRVYAQRAGLGGMGPLVAGAHAGARELRYRDLLVHTIGPAIVSVTVVVVGLYIVALWLRRRDASYLLFGLAATLWGLHTATSILPQPLLPQPHWIVWWHTVYMLFVVLLCLFCVRFAGLEWRLYRRLTVAFALMVAPVLYAANAADNIEEASSYVRLVGIGFVAVALVAVARYAFRMRNVESAFLLATGAIATAFAVHDWLADQDPLALRPVWLVPYSALAFLVLLGWILTDRFVRALNEYESLNIDLERRIAAKAASLESQLAETSKAREEADAANRAKSRFLAAASHDLRQPLHALSMFAGALPGHTRDDEGAELVQRIKMSVTSLEALLLALLDISKLDAGAIVAEPKDVHLDEIFKRLPNDFVPEALDKELKLAIVPTSLVIHSDPALLERILRNLVANALRYTQRGGVVVGARRRGNRVAIEVWDSGPGIDAAERERIFEEFYQVGNPERDRMRGLGLGLAIVRRLANLLGHKVELASRLGHGSVFRVLVSAGDPRGDALVATTPVPEAADSIGGRCIVVIDDEAPVREGTRNLLCSWGCSVIASGDPEEALAALAGAIPSALLVDYRLRAGLDGLRAIARIRAALGQDVPAMLVSGESSAEELSRIKASGLLLLHKPVPPAKLRSALAFVLAMDQRQ